MLLGGRFETFERGLDVSFLFVGDGELIMVRGVWLHAACGFKNTQPCFHVGGGDNCIGAACIIS